MTQLQHNNSFSQEIEPGSEGIHIHFITSVSQGQIHGFDLLRTWLKEKGFATVSSTQFKIIERKEVRRPINPANPNGLTELVEIEEIIDINSDFKLMRQLISRIGREPQNLLLIELERAKGESFCLNLIIEHLRKLEKDIIVTRMPLQVKQQLFSKIDLNFKTIPQIIAKNPRLRNQLVERSKRVKGMQSCVRGLVGMPFFPPAIKKKLRAFSLCQDVIIAPAEAVNIILLADLHSRYEAMLKSFELDMMESRAPVTAMASVFSKLMKDVPLDELRQKLAPYLPKKSKLTSRAQIFSYLYSLLPKLKKKQERNANDGLSDSDLFRRIQNIFIFNRSQYDPDLWKQCIFFDINYEEPIETREANERALENLSQDVKQLFMNYRSARTQGLSDIYSIHNAYRLINNRTVKFGSANLNNVEAKLVKSYQKSFFNLKEATELDEKFTTFFEETEEKHPGSRLSYPVHIISRAYGNFLAHKLDIEVRKFLAPGMTVLNNKYGNNFFDILYEVAVSKKNIPISRNKLAQWLTERKLIGNVKNKGWIPNKIEHEYNTGLTTSILLKSGTTLHPDSYSKHKFHIDYLKSEQNFKEFFITQKKAFQKQKDRHNPAIIFCQMLEKGIFNLQSVEFRNFIKKTPIFKSLTDIITKAALPILDDLYAHSFNDKMVIKIPLALEGYLYIKNTFEIIGSTKKLNIHLVAVPVTSSEKLTSYSKLFSEELEQVLERSLSPADKMLHEAQSTLVKFKNLTFFELTSMMFLDRALTKTIEEELSQKKLEPQKIKYGLSDPEKLMIGNVVDINLSNLFDYASRPIGSSVSQDEQISIGKLVHSLDHISVVTKVFDRLREESLQISILLNKFSAKSKETKEWKQYSKLIREFIHIISYPIADFDERKINALEELALKFEKFIRAETLYETSIVSRFIEVWKYKNPDNEDAIYFFSIFLPRKSNKADNIIIKIRESYKQMARLKTVKVICFFPESSKKFHLKHLGYFSRILQILPFKIETFIETSSLIKEQVEELSKIYHPCHFFRLSRLDPEE